MPVAADAPNSLEPVEGVSGNLVGHATVCDKGKRLRKTTTVVKAFLQNKPSHSGICLGGATCGILAGVSSVDKVLAAGLKSKASSISTAK